jgi:hypothetical protein
MKLIFNVDSETLLGDVLDNGDGVRPLLSCYPLNFEPTRLHKHPHSQL